MADTADHLRAFISIPVDDAVLREIARLQRRLEQASPPDAVRWAAPDQMHLTLKFLGDIPAAAVDQLAAGLRDIARLHPALDLRAAALGCFPNPRSPRVLWIGLDGDLPQLERLQSDIERLSAPLAQKEEHRAFSPHLTIGRVRENAARHARRIGEAIQAAAVPPLGQWTAREVLLMRSDLSPHGATHTPLARLPLSR